MYRIFVDGQEGTTGLKINDFLASRKDIEVLKIDSEERKNPAKRRILLNKADIVFLCLPDSISKESVSMIENNNKDY
jgi:N-acetyl-gamma-glutamyl-phosphate reductase